jgi:hypothetical protein
MPSAAGETNSRPLELAETAFGKRTGMRQHDFVVFARRFDRPQSRSIRAKTWSSVDAICSCDAREDGQALLDPGLVAVADVDAFALAHDGAAVVGENDELHDAAVVGDALE